MICVIVFYLVRVVGLKYRHKALLEQVGHNKFHKLKTISLSFLKH